MSESIVLPAQKRDTATKAKLVRKAGRITAEVYGAGVKNTQISLDYHTFRRAYVKAGASTIITLEVEGGSAQKVLVHSIQQDPVTDLFSHIDFLAVNMNKKVTTEVPVRIVGESPAIKMHGGIFSLVGHTIEVRALPGDLPHDIEVDVTGMAELHASLHVKDITIGGKVEVLSAPEMLICQILAPKTTEQLEAELSTPIGDTLSEDARKAAEEEKAAAAASKASDTEKKGSK